LKNCWRVSAIDTGEEREWVLRESASAVQDEKENRGHKKACVEIPLGCCCGTRRDKGRCVAQKEGRKKARWCLWHAEE